jgi:hypothetical protein
VPLSGSSAELCVGWYLLGRKFIKSAFKGDEYVMSVTPVADSVIRHEMIGGRIFRNNSKFLASWDCVGQIAFSAI